MNHDVFLCHAGESREVVDELCEALEAAGVKCWVAPRDIDPGVSYAASIMQAIHATKLFVLVYSQYANTSPHILRELERAINAGLPIVPLLIEDTPVGDEVGYYISSTQWLVAYPPPLESRMPQVIRTIKRGLRREDEVVSSSAPAANTVSEGGAPVNVVPKAPEPSAIPSPPPPAAAASASAPPPAPVPPVVVTDPAPNGPHHPGRRLELCAATLAILSALLYVLSIFPTYDTNSIVDKGAGLILLNLSCALPTLIGGALLFRGIGSPTIGWTVVAASLYIGGEQVADLVFNNQYIHQFGAGLVMQNVAALAAVIAAVVVVIVSRGESDARLHGRWPWRTAIGLALVAGMLGSLSQLWFQFGDATSIYSRPISSRYAITFVAIVLMAAPIASLFVGAGRGACMVAGLALVFGGQTLGAAWYESDLDAPFPHDPNAFFWLAVLSTVAMGALAWILGQAALARPRADVPATTSS